MRLRKLVADDWVNVSPGLVLVGWERIGGDCNSMYLFEGTAVGKFKCGKMG